MLSLEPLGLDSVMLDEARAYLRVDATGDDPSLTTAMLAAVGHAENFTRTTLLQRTVREMMSAGTGWQTLRAVPVQTVTSATGIPAEGPRFAMTADAWEAKISSRGDAYVRIFRPGIAGRVEVACVAGLVTEWADLPEVLRLGVLRLTAHYYAHRDAAVDAGPPAAARALLLPWRRMRLA